MLGNADVLMGNADVLMGPHPRERRTLLAAFIDLLDHVGVLAVLGCEALCAREVTGWNASARVPLDGPKAPFSGR